MNKNIIKLEKSELPDKLKNIKNPPEKLYAIGDIKLLFEKNFGIVGTRKITEYGENNCRFFSKELVLRDIPIVSGMALGTDTVAHKTALENNGKTIAVLGSGFNNIFPQNNIKLFEEIVDNNGLVITEFEKEEKPLKENFPKRNRIITAISEGILVIEAGYRSGTSITVRNAKVQGKNVFALPGKLDSPVGIGVNKMIKDGAILTTGIEDILKYYPDFKSRTRKEVNKIKLYFDMKQEYIPIINILKQKGKNIEQILLESDLSLKELLNLLTNMELEGIIRQEFGGIYKIID